MKTKKPRQNCRGCRSLAAQVYTNGPVWQALVRSRRWRWLTLSGGRLKMDERIGLHIENRDLWAGGDKAEKIGAADSS